MKQCKVDFKKKTEFVYLATVDEKNFAQITKSKPGYEVKFEWMNGTTFFRYLNEAKEHIKIVAKDIL